MKAAFFILTTCLALTACKKDEVQQAPQTTDETPLAAPAQVDEGFTYQGKPIDPICFNQPGDASGEEPIDLAACTGSAGQDEYTVPKNGLETFEDGAIGYTFKCEGGCMREPYVAYRHLGRVDGLDAVLVESSGGGTGTFTSIGLYELKDGKLTRKKALNGGDRCNGGIDSADVKDGQLHYSANITPFDLVEMSGGNQAGFKAYDEIQACAVCCIGTANYTGEKLDSVTLSLDPKDIVNEDLGPKDACFFGTYNETYMAGKTMLNDAALKLFGQTFNKRCGDLAGKDLPPTIPSGATPSSVDQPVPANP